MPFSYCSKVERTNEFIEPSLPQAIVIANAKKKTQEGIASEHDVVTRGASTRAGVGLGLWVGLG